MDFGRLIFQLPQEQRQCIRKVENISKKLINANFAVIFNDICIRENLLPTFTNIRTLDPAVRQSDFTVRFRRDLLRNQKEKKLKEVTEFEIALKLAKARWTSAENITPELRMNIDGTLEEIIDQHHHPTKTRIVKKLTNLNNGPLLIPYPREGYINLTDVNLTPNQKRLLNLGLNCHIQKKTSLHHKRMEIETLIEDIQELQKKRKITTSPNLIAELVAESGRQRGSTRSKLLDKDLVSAAKELRENENIIIRKADKTAVYVLMPRDEYLQKMETILNDPSKFCRIPKDTTATLKAHVNRILDAVMQNLEDLIFKRSRGNFHLAMLMVT